MLWKELSTEEFFFFHNTFSLFFSLCNVFPLFFFNNNDDAPAATMVTVAIIWCSKASLVLLSRNASLTKRRR